MLIFENKQDMQNKQNQNDKSGTGYEITEAQQELKNSN